MLYNVFSNREERVPKFIKEVAKSMKDNKGLSERRKKIFRQHIDDTGHSVLLYAHHLHDDLLIQ